MSVKVAINGFGRIGRLAFRLMADNPAFDIVAINSSRGAEILAYLLKYDSAHGKFKENAIEAKENALLIDNKTVKILSERDPENLPWGDLGIDVVIESTGVFTDEVGAGKHIKAGAKKVIVSASSKGDIKNVVFNVNNDVLDGSEKIISGSSCTTNCLAPIVKVLDDNFGLVSGIMTTVHAYTNDQATIDRSHNDLRRGRAAAANIVPTSTGAAAGIGKILPALNGKLDGFALRVPVLTGSLVDLTCVLEKDVTKEDINAAMKKSVNETLGYNEEQIVSTDIIGIHYGSLYDATLTKVMDVEGGKQQVKIIAWYDNEMSYTAQLVRLAEYVASKL